MGPWELLSTPHTKGGRPRGPILAQGAVHSGGGGVNLESLALDSTRSIPRLLIEEFPLGLQHPCLIYLGNHPF